MMLNPRKGQRVRLWYRKKVCHLFPLHGKIGTVVVVFRRTRQNEGSPRNHGVEVGGELVVVPCGNLKAVTGKR